LTIRESSVADPSIGRPQLAMLGAFVDAQAISAPRSVTSVPTVARDPGALYEPVSCDNFG
jgi:hypothetical protein